MLFFTTVGVSSTSFIVVDLGILGLAFTIASYFSKEALQVFFFHHLRFSASEGLGISRPSLTLDEICVFRKPSETRPEQGGIRRNWPDSDGTCHHQRAEQSPSARKRHRYLCFRPLTSETSIQQLAEVLSRKWVLGTRFAPRGASFDAARFHSAPRSPLSQPEPDSVPVPPDSALWPSTKAVRLHVHPTSAHNKLRSLHMLRMRAGNVFKAISIS